MKILNFENEKYKVVGSILTEKITKEEIPKFKLAYGCDMVLRAGDTYLFLDKIDIVEIENTIANPVIEEQITEKELQTTSDIQG